MDNCILLRSSLGVSRALCGIHQWGCGQELRTEDTAAARRCPLPQHQHASPGQPPAARGLRGSAASARPPPASARRFRRGPCRGGSVRRWLPGGGGARSGSSRSTSCRTSPSRSSSTCSRCCPPPASTRAA